MAYGVKYRLEFTDIQRDEWKVDILEDSYTGPVTSMIPSGNPLTIEWLTAGDELTLNPIKGSVITLNVECTTNFQYIDLYDEEDLVRPVSVYKNEVLYWTGWLSNDYTEPYDSVPYTVSTTAADGLGKLKDIPYKDGEDDYAGRVTSRAIILEILGKIGHSQFTEYCNIYEDRMADGVSDSPFNQEYIDNDLFIGADCYSVLQAILLKFNAIIRQQAGEFIIYRPAELVGTTIYGRIITFSLITGTSIAPDKVLDRDAMDLIDVNGGVLMIQQPMGLFTAEQDYGSKESWIKNHNFGVSTWDVSQFDNWAKSGSIYPLSFMQEFAGEDDGVMIYPDGSGVNYRIQQTFGHQAKATSDVMVFSFEYRLIKIITGTASNVDIRLRLRYPDTYMFLHNTDEVTAEWSAINPDITFEIPTVEPGLGNWTQVSYQIPDGLPLDGPLEIYLYATDTAGVRIAYRNVRFYATNDIVASKATKVSRWKDWVNAIPPIGLIRFFGGGYKKATRSWVEDREEVVSRIYEASNSLEAPEGNQVYILGDCEDTGLANVLEQYRGALAVLSSGTLTQTAINFVNSNAASYLAYGTVLTSSSNKLRFTAAVPGTDFAGNTTIVNASGNLAGTVEVVTANTAGTAQIETITLSGGSGEIIIHALGNDYPLTYITSLTATAAKFVTDYAADFVSLNITLTSSDENIIFTESTIADGFIAPTFSNVSGTLTATVYHTQASSDPVARVDEITLTGTSGTATVTADGVVTTITFSSEEVMSHTTTWHTRGGSEDKPLIELIADEVAELHSRGRHFIQLSMYELTESLNIIGNLQDPLNKIGADNRVFAFNRGALDCQAREWTADFIEVGIK